MHGLLHWFLISQVLLFLPSCTAIQAGVSEDCYGYGWAIGKGKSEVQCTPETIRYIIAPGGEFPDGIEIIVEPLTPVEVALEAQRSGYLPDMIEALQTLPEEEKEVRKNLEAAIESAENRPIPIPPPIRDTTIEDACFEYGCTIEKVSATSITIQGGPPDGNLLSGIFDAMMAIGTWVAAKYFGGGL